MLNMALRKLRICIPAAFCVLTPAFCEWRRLSRNQLSFSPFTVNNHTTRILPYSQIAFTGLRKSLSCVLKKAVL